MKEYEIYIPSRNREKLLQEKRGVWKYIDPDCMTHPVKLLVRNSESFNYLEVLRKRPRGEDCIVGPISFKGMPNNYTIADKRQEAINTCQSEYLFIIDDDVVFSYRNEDISSKYTSNHSEFMKRGCFDSILYECMQLCSEKYPIVGLPLRQGSFKLKYVFAKNIPIIRFVCYHIPTLRKNNIRANGMDTPFMSDRYTHLSLLDKGYTSLSNCRFAVDDGGTNKKGGCSDTRTVGLQTEAAKKLQALFPEKVSLRWKENGSWGERRLDCRISWRSFLKENELPYLPMEEGLKIIGEEK